MGRLFDETHVQPDKTGYAEHSESNVGFLRTSATTPALNVRELLESWFQQYPAAHQHELRRRVHSGGHSYDSAIFELVLHAMLLRARASVEVHPQVSTDSLRRPDFLVSLESGFEFYLEAVLAQGHSVEDQGRKSVLNDFYAAFDRKFVSPKFFWSLTVIEYGSGAIRSAPVVKLVGDHMASLDYDAVREENRKGSIHGRYACDIQADGWLLRFEPVAKNPEACGKDTHTALGMFPMAEAEICSDDEDIKASILGKVKHHRGLCKPYVIAVNAMRYSVHEVDYFDALLGKEAIRIRQDLTGKTTSEPIRTPNGVWSGRKPGQNAHLIAVIGFLRCSAWSLATCVPTVFENPYISFNQNARIAGLRRFERGPDRMVEVGGKSLGELFSLPNDWPGQF